MKHTKPALLALLTLAVSAHANEEKSDSHLSLGIGAGYNSGIYKDYDSSRWGAVPLLHYEDQHFYLDGGSAGVKLYNSENQTLTLGAGFSGNEFKPNRSRDARLQQLDKRKAGVSANTSVIASTPAMAVCKPVSRKTSPARAKAHK